MCALSPIQTLKWFSNLVLKKNFKQLNVALNFCLNKFPTTPTSIVPLSLLQSLFTLMTSYLNTSSLEM